MSEITRRRCCNCVSFQPTGDPAYCTNLVSFFVDGMRRDQTAESPGCNEHCTAEEDLAADSDHASAREFIVNLFGRSSLS